MRRSGEDERWRERAADRKLWKERTERLARQYLTDPHPCTAGNKEEEHTVQRKQLLELLRDIFPYIKGTKCDRFYYKIMLCNPYNIHLKILTIKMCFNEHSIGTDVAN